MVSESAAAPQSDPVYDAFASHATDPDGTLVRRVEAVLEAFHRQRGLPARYVRELQLCVDGRDFVFPRRQRGSAAEIEPIVRAYQKKSRALLVFSGPLSREHPWVNSEIDWWGEERPDGPIYFALTHGPDPAARESYMPEALIRRGGPDIPVFFDLRGFYLWGNVPFLVRFSGLSARERQLRSEARHWRSARSFGEELTKLAAQLISDATGASISVAELVSAYREVERRQRLWALIRGGILALVLAGLLGLLAYATNAFFTEQANRRVTSWEQQATLLSASTGPGLVEALAFAASAVKSSDDAAALAALYDVFPRLMPVDQTIRPVPGDRASEQTQTAMLFGRDAWLATGGRDGILHVSDTASGALLAELPLNCGRIRAIVPLPTGDLIAIASDRGLRFVSVVDEAGQMTLSDAGTVLEGTRVAAIAAGPAGILYAGELYGQLWRLDPDPAMQGAGHHYQTTSLGVIADPRDASGDLPSSVFGMALRGTELIVAVT